VVFFVSGSLAGTSVFSCDAMICLDDLPAGK
jgi:hypothetical protein